MKRILYTLDDIWAGFCNGVERIPFWPVFWLGYGVWVGYLIWGTK